jgi:ribosomal subunit interface protein
MEMSFTGRDLQITDEMRETATRKLSSLSRLEPRAMALDLEVIGEHHPKVDGVKRVEAALRIPRKTFRAHAEADDVPTAIDRVRDKLERQVRDHHGKKRKAKHPRGVASGTTSSAAESSPTEEP